MPAASPATRPDAVAAALRDEVLDGTLAPAAALTEAAVTLRFGVARPTARLALDRLVAEGLLRREANSAARVPQLDRDDILDLYASRVIVEAAASAELARAGAVPAEAVAAHRRVRAAASGDSFARDDIAFHRALVDGLSGPRLARMHELLMGEVELCIGQVHAHHLLSAQDLADQHQGILDAIVAGDPDQAERLTREHIEGARDALLAHYDARTATR